MPVYEYQCSKCGKTFELRRKFSDPPVTVHEECGGTVEQLLSAPAFQLKGTGWYVTDYAKDGKKKDAKKDGDSKESGGSKADSKPESKGDSGSGGDSKSGDSAGSSTESKSPAKTESKPAATKADG